MRIQSTVGGAVLALAAGILASASARPPAVQRLVRPAPTVSSEVRVILQSHCTICHSRGGPSPMALATADDVLPWAQKIKEQVLARRMPIWHAARGYGAFSNDPTLTPHELALLVRWADGGWGGEGGKGANDANGANGAKGAEGAGAKGAVSAKGAGETSMTVRVPNGWITGWTFVPGDPLITSATFTSADGATIGAWTAGDKAVRLPLGSAIRLVSPVRVEMRRREPASYESAFTPRRSSLQFSRLAAEGSHARPAPSRRVRFERLACGGTIGPSEATLIGVRPRLAAGTSAQVTIERLGGAAPALVGWFRHVDPNYTRIYWLDRPLDFVANARLTSDAPCELDLVLSSRR